MKTKELSIPGYEKVVEAELTGGVTAIIAIHNTHLGPALGGCRFFPYHSKEEALTDVLRLSEGMSYKAALASLPLGGGKSVIIGDPKTAKSEAMLESFGAFVDSFGGRYITAKDVGVDIPDLDIMARKSKFVRGTSDKASGGDPSPVTAYGVYKGILAAAKFRWGDSSVKGKRIVVQGLGHVGYGVAKLLREDGATILATDIDQNNLDKGVKDLGITAIKLDDWQTTAADIFCPCAMGAIVNKQTIPLLKAAGIQIIAGGANNQLLDVFKDGERLKDADITYAPDFVINAGGLINIACELDGTYDGNKALKKTEHIYDVLLEIFTRAKKENKPTAIISHQMAREKIGLS